MPCFQPLRRAAAALCASSLLWAAGLAAAQDDAGQLNQRFWVQLGGFRASADSSARVDYPSGGRTGTVVDLERDLGLAPRRSLGTLLLGARGDGAWRAEFEVLALSRQSRRQVLASNIVWENTVYPASVSVDSEVDSRVYRLGVGYSFHRTPASEVGLVAGLHVTEFKLMLAGDAQVGNNPALQSRREQKQATVPLPTVGAYGTWALSSHWLLAARGDLLWLRLRGYDGRLGNLSASGFYRLTPQVALGAGYRWVDYRLDATRPSYTGRFEYRFSGPQLLLDVGF